MPIKRCFVKNDRIFFKKRLTNGAKRGPIELVKTSSVVWKFTENSSLAERRIIYGEGETALRVRQKKNKKRS